MIRHSTLTPSTSLRGPAGSSAVHSSTSTSPLAPRLVSGAIVLALYTLIMFLIFAFPVLVAAQSAGTLQNPLNSAFSSVPNFIAGFLKVVVMVALPIISLFIVYSGFMFVMARGNSEKLGQARENFLWVIIGAILILGAWVIATLIGGTVSQLTTG